MCQDCAKVSSDEPETKLDCKATISRTITDVMHLLLDEKNSGLCCEKVYAYWAEILRCATNLCQNCIYESPILAHELTPYIEKDSRQRIRAMLHLVQSKKGNLIQLKKEE